MSLDEVKLNLDRQAIDELDVLAHASGKLKQLVVAAAEASPAIGMVQVARQIAEQVGMAVWELRPLLAAIINFYHTSTRLELTPAETAEVVARSLRRMAKTAEDKERLQFWESEKDKVAEAANCLSPDHPLEAAQKALRVAVSRQYELVDMRIFTDARPVFNAAGDAITQTIITHVLSLDYHDGHNHRIIQFSLDAEDLTNLGEQCERAARKASVIKKDLRLAPWPTSIFREPIISDDLDKEE